MRTYSIPKPNSTSPNENKYTLVPSGDHDLTVVFATDVDEEGVALVTKAGDPRIKVKVMTENEQSFYHFLYLTEKAYPMVWEFLAAGGVMPTGEGQFILDPTHLEGKRFRATVYEQDGSNRLRKPIRIPTSEQPTPEPAEEVASEPSAQSAQSAQEDDVPF